MLRTNNNLLNKRDNTEDSDSRCFIECLFSKIWKFHRVASEVEETCKFSEKRQGYNQTR